MCVVSMVSDGFKDTWYPPKPVEFPRLPDTHPLPRPDIERLFKGTVTREEFEKLKQEVELLRALLKRAIEYDKRTDQSHCEQDEKVALLKKVAEKLGISLDDLL